MGKSLLFERTKKIFLFITLLLGVAASGVFGQSLSAGDVAFTGFNSDDPGEGFAIVLFADVSGSQEIHFSSKEWNGSSFAGSGGDLTWIAPSGGVSSGDIIVLSDVEDTPSVNIGSITDDANMNLSGSGDVIYSYTSTDNKSNGTFTFLGAIATDNNKYSQADGQEGTLDNTNLTQGEEAILLDDNIDVGEYIGPRVNTLNRFPNDLNETTNNWEYANGSGDQSGQILPFNSKKFDIVSPPTVAFSDATLSEEEGNSINLNVYLAESNGTAIDVDITFLPSSSSAGSGDINGFSSQTVSFASNDGQGSTKNVSITPNAGDGFEGTEKAVFQLQNNSAGGIIEPSVLELTIEDSEAPDIVFNEINAAPGNDANGDGVTDSDTDEFVELVNNENTDVDISGWQFWENSQGTRFVFPEGTVLPAQNAVVLFDNSNNELPQGNFGGALVFSDNEIGLNNSSETLSLKDEVGNTITTTSYPNEASGESNVLSPEITGSSYDNHSNVSSGDLKSSPGTDADGNPFGSDHAIAFRDNEGWRMISSPVQSASFDDLFGQFWMQGIAESDDPNGEATLFSWTESGGGSFSKPGNMSNTMTPGKGYIVYVFEDDEFSTPGIQGGFPKIIQTNKNENSGTVNVDVSSNDANSSSGIDGNEGWNLLGNPFASDISAAAVIDALESVNSNINTNISVWNSEFARWEVLDGSDGSSDKIAPFQAFFIRYTSGFGTGQVSFDKNALEINEGTDFYKNNIEAPITFDLQLHGEQYFDTYSVEFSENGSTDLDRFDAYKLFSLNPNSINLYSTLSNNRLQKNVLPKELESNLEIPLFFDASGRTSLQFQWGSLDELPNEWDVVLIDNETGREINLRNSKEYAFNLSKEESQAKELNNRSDKKGLLKEVKKEDNGEPRFLLSLRPNTTNSASSEIPESAKLNPNYPNPFNPSTTISYELAEDSEVTLSIWNMIGQKVATLVDGMVEAGTHEQTWNASNMPSGMYIARLEVGAQVFTRKMTLIK